MGRKNAFSNVSRYVYNTPTTGLHYGVCTQRSRGMKGRGLKVAIWRTEMEKRENNSRAASAYAEVWSNSLTKKILMQGMAWILIWCKPHRCVQGMLCPPSASPLSSAYTWRQGCWCCTIWLRSNLDLLSPYFTFRYWGWIVRVQCEWGRGYKRKT